MLAPEREFLAAGGRRRRAAGVVDQDVDRAQPVLDQGHLGVDHADVGEIPPQPQCPGTHAPDLVRGALGGVAVDVADGDLRAFAGQAARDGGAEAAAGPQDERRLAFELEIHANSLQSVRSLRTSSPVACEGAAPNRPVT